MTGPCFDNATDIQCSFNGTIVPAEIVDFQVVRCISPFMKDANGPVTLALSLDGGLNFNFSTTYYFGRLMTSFCVLGNHGDGCVTACIPQFFGFDALNSRLMTWPFYHI